MGKSIISELPSDLAAAQAGRLEDVDRDMVRKAAAWAQYRDTARAAASLGLDAGEFEQVMTHPVFLWCYHYISELAPGICLVSRSSLQAALLALDRGVQDGTVSPEQLDLRVKVLRELMKTLPKDDRVTVRHQRDGGGQLIAGEVEGAADFLGGA